MDPATHDGRDRAEAGAPAGDEALIDQVRRFWDADAETYDHSATHWPQSPAEEAAWTALLRAALPDPPARVLDVGAGTGFLTLPAASLGHETLALDLSPAMLGVLVRKARAAQLGVATRVAVADAPPPGPFDAVMCRHLLWTLPDPVAALTAWRAAAPHGQLLVVEGAWGGGEPGQAWRQQARRALRWVQRRRPAHHGTYDPAVWEALPLGDGTDPSVLVEAVRRAGWRDVALSRLHDVEWARLRPRPAPERWLGPVPQFAVRAR